MGYQALLFCPDEKLARVVNQVFGELDFSIEAVIEPFAAVKKLMAQRYDAIVVDCENEQNASLLFKSARNSTFNQSSLAIALVEGQAGVAKAYRIGANLVLTKPINVEQAKGTLRVARGLLRKNSESAAPATPAPATVPAKPLPTPGPGPVPVNRSVPAVVPSAPRPEISTFERSVPPVAVELPAMVASAATEEKAKPAQEPVSEIRMPIARALAIETKHSVPELVTQTEPAKPSVASPAPSSSAQPSFIGSAAAPAPAKEVVAFPPPENAVVEAAPAKPLPPTVSNDAAHAPVRGSSLFASSTVSDAPSFGSLGEEDSDGSGGSKKLLIPAVAVVALAVIGYFGYGKFSKPATSTTPAPVISSQNTSEPAPKLAPLSEPVAPSTSTPERPKASNSLLATAPAPTSGRSPVTEDNQSIRIEAGEPQTAKLAKPIVVKSGNGSTPTQGEESAPQLPGTVASADNGLAGLVTSTPVVLPKAAPSTIKISQGVSQGLLIKRVQPKYPQAALSVHAQGAVQIEATVNKDGTVTNVKVLKGDPVLSRAAVEAVRQWRYKPYYLDGQPVEIQTQITVNFKAD